MQKLLYVLLILSFCQCREEKSLKEEVTGLLYAEILARGEKVLVEEPVTLTAYPGLVCGP